MLFEEIETLANNPGLLEIGRKAVENVLIEFRDDRISTLRNNGLVIKERDGSPSDVIRLGLEEALAIALKAIAKDLERQFNCTLNNYAN